ncbi:hypothetical protein Hanom_Chr02g00161451 [Helianthus anomalus]
MWIMYVQALQLFIIKYSKIECSLKHKQIFTSLTLFFVIFTIVNVKGWFRYKPYLSYKP